AVYFNGAVGEKPRDACGGAMLVVTRRLLVLTLLALASSAAVLFAQSVSGSVSGTVVDQTRQVLPGATVTLLNEQTGDSRAIQTSDVGAHHVEPARDGRRPRARRRVAAPHPSGRRLFDADRRTRRQLRHDDAEHQRQPRDVEHDDR